MLANLLPYLAVSGTVISTMLMVSHAALVCTLHDEKKE